MAFSWRPIKEISTLFYCYLCVVESCLAYSHSVFHLSLPSPLTVFNHPEINCATPTHFNCLSTSHNLWLALCPQSKSKSKCTRTLIRSPFHWLQFYFKVFSICMPNRWSSAVLIGPDRHSHLDYISALSDSIFYEFIGRELNFSAGKSGLPVEHFTL